MTGELSKIFDGVSIGPLSEMLAVKSIIFINRCEELNVQPRGTRGESGGQTGCTYDISNKHRLGYSEVQLVQTMIDGVNTLYAEDVALQKKQAEA